MIPISVNVVRTLRHMLDSDLTMRQLREVDQRTLAPAIRRGYLRRNGGRVELTEEGVEMARKYGGQGLLKRKVERDVSHTVSDLLGMAKIVKLKSKRQAA